MTSTAPRPASSAIEGPGPRSLFDGQRTTGEQLLVKAFVVVPLLALLAAVPLAWGWGLSWTDIGLAVSFYFLSGLGITVGFHRHFTHRAFKATRALKIGLAITGSMAFQGPIINWVADHRRHHAFTDKEGDPHSPWLFGTSPLAVAKGFVHAHLSWLFARDKTNAARFAPDLLADRDLQRVHRQFIGWSLVSLAAPALLGGVITWSWWGAVTGFFWAGLVRLAVLNHVTWSINSICHMIGSRPFTVPGPFHELLATGDRVDGRVLAQLPPRRPDLCASRRAARSAGHVRPADRDLREARVGLRHPLAHRSTAGPPHRAPAGGARRPGVT